MQSEAEWYTGADEFRLRPSAVRAPREHPIRRRDGLARQSLHGAIHTPSGDKIPARVVLYPARVGESYSHVGAVSIPLAWVDEFAESMSRFLFCSEDGECFAQLQVLEELYEAEGPPALSGRIILMRERSEDLTPALGARH